MVLIFQLANPFDMYILLYEKQNNLSFLIKTCSILKSVWLIRVYLLFSIQSVIWGLAQTNWRLKNNVYTLHIDIFLGNRLRNIAVTVGQNLHKMEHCSNFKGPGKNGQFIVLTCKTPISGRYVKILRSGKGYLSLAEVQVIGHTGKHFKIYLKIYLVVCLYWHPFYW